MSSSLDDLLREELTEEQRDVVLHIYIGQNVRDEGILKQDPALVDWAPIVEFLIDREIVEQSRWYKFEVLTISYRFTVPVRTIVEERLRNNRQEICSSLQDSISKNVLSFMVFEYLSEGLSFPVEKDWLLDWRAALLQDDTIKKYKLRFFSTLIDLGFCVRTSSYVSTRGGELRDEEYVISTEVRRLLQEIIPHTEFPSPFLDLADIHRLILDDLEYEVGTVKVNVKDEVLTELGDVHTIKESFNRLLDRLNSTNVVYEMRKIPGLGTELTANRDTPPQICVVCSLR